MIACTMSMDVMGVKKEELMDNVVLGGVATYLERAEDANVNFIHLIHSKKISQHTHNKDNAGIFLY